ncbi:MAG: caspase family protein [Betaproteobacteria bacterium]
MSVMRVRRHVLAAVLLILVVSPMAPAVRAQSRQPLDIEPVSTAEIREIRAAFQGIGLREADVAKGIDGRISLVGEYENRDEVETAFAAARAIVGLQRVAPTTPASIKYRLKGFDTAFASTVGKMMQRKALPDPPSRPATAVPPDPPSRLATAAPPTKAASPRGPRTFGLVFGVGKFKYLPEANSLEFAEKDAIDVYNFLISPTGGGLRRDSIRLLRQEEATSAAVKGALRELLEQTQAGDTVILFAASHGLPNAMNKFDIVLHDTEFPRRQVGAKDQAVDFVITKRSTALADDDLQGFVAQLTLKDVRSVVVLDTCYSGKTFVSIPGYLPSRTRSLSQHKKEVEYSASLSQEAITDLAQQAKDAKATRIVIVSASENEESMESPRANGGLFTQTYIAALTKIHDYADAFDQAKPMVIRSARTVGHSQTPRLLAVPESAITKM